MPPLQNTPTPSHTHDLLVHVHLPVGLSGDIQIRQLPLIVLGVNSAKHKLPSRLPGGVPGERRISQSVSHSLAQDGHQKARDQKKGVKWGNQGGLPEGGAWGDVEYS